MLATQLVQDVWFTCEDMVVTSAEKTAKPFLDQLTSARADALQSQIDGLSRQCAAGGGSACVAEEKVVSTCWQD